MSERDASSRLFSALLNARTIREYLRGNGLTSIASEVGQLPPSSRSNRGEEVAQRPRNVVGKLIDEEMSAGEGGRFRVAEALAPFRRYIEELGHLPGRAIEDQRWTFHAAFDV